MKTIQWRYKTFFLTISMFLLCACDEAKTTYPADGPPNILFVAIDDLNDWVGFLGGHPDTKTPNLDRLADRGVYFTNAYTVSPICGPSRASVLTGMRPETTGVYNNKGMYKDYVPDAIALPRFLKDNGYYVMGSGKINHAMGMVVPENYDEYGPDAGAIGGPFTWEELSMTPGEEVDRSDILGQAQALESGVVKDVYPGKVIKRGTLSATLPLNGIDNFLDRPENGYNTFDWGPVDVADDEMPDGKMARWAAQKLDEDYDEPFFLGVGFYRPHQPFYAPRKYFDSFGEKPVSLPDTTPFDLSDMPEVASHYAHFPWSGSFERVREYEAWNDAVRGYLASIHFVDAQVGIVLDALEASPYRDNTLIVLWSDHGWELGEKEHWGKHSPWEGSTRVPFLIVPPKAYAMEKGAQASFVSLLDIFPTIADYAQLPIGKHLEGKSLKPLVEGRVASVRDYNVTTLGRGSYALRSGNFKFISYYDGTEELYDLENDPNEWINLAGRVEYQEMLGALHEKLPVDGRFKRLIRYKNWKALITANDEFLLFDMLATPNGIGEHSEVSAENEDVVAHIRERLLDYDESKRNVLIVDEAIDVETGPTVSWNAIGQLPDNTGGENQPTHLGLGGALIGVHNDALIIAGGSNFPVSEGGDLWSDDTVKVYYDDIRVATRGSDDGRLSWHAVGVKLPDNSAYGATASHPLGMIVAGGTNGVSATNTVNLLRWDDEDRQLSLLDLPALPSESTGGGAAIIGDTLYVLLGSNDRTTTADLYAFDMSRIEIDSTGNPIHENGTVNIRPRLNTDGQPIDPWRKMPSIPEGENEDLSRSAAMVVAQSGDGGEMLYVIGGRRRTTLDENRDAIPVGLGDDRYYLHFYNDVWAFNPRARNGSGEWARKADMEVNGRAESRSAGTALALDKSRIAVLSGARGDTLREAYGRMGVGWEDFPRHPGFQRAPLFYDVKKDTWIGGSSAPLVADPMGEQGHKVAASAVTTKAVFWRDTIVYPTGEVRPRVRTPVIWSLHIEN